MEADLKIGTKPGHMIERNYPRNAWWIAAFGDEVTSQPLGRRLLDQPVVLYRLEDGTPVALEDRCIHRWAPLSKGTVIGSDVVCPYHGFRFGPDGRCTSIPTQTTVPEAVRVRTYPVQEVGPFVWIWMGNPDRCNESQPVAVPWASDPAWVVAKGQMPTSCNYMILQENVLDLTHFGFLHANSLGQTGWTEPPKSVISDDNSVTYSQSFEQIQLAPFQAVPTGIGEKPVDREDWGTFHVPAIHIGGIDIHDPQPAPGVLNKSMVRIVHAITPESSGKSHYWWMTMQNYALDDIEFLALTSAMTQKVFGEDKVICEAIQDVADLDEPGMPGLEISIAADKAGILARRAVSRLMEKD